MLLHQAKRGAFLMNSSGLAEVARILVFSSSSTPPPTPLAHLQEHPLPKGVPLQFDEELDDFGVEDFGIASRAKNSERSFAAGGG